MARRSKNIKKSRVYSKTQVVPQSGTYSPALRDIETSPTIGVVQSRLDYSKLHRVMDQVEDNRRPRVIKYPRTIFGTKASVVPAKHYRRNYIVRYGPFYKRVGVGYRGEWGYQYKHPAITIECIRRRIRRRMIFSIPGARGKGSGRKTRRKPKYKGIRC